MCLLIPWKITRELIPGCITDNQPSSNPQMIVFIFKGSPEIEFLIWSEIILSKRIIHRNASHLISQARKNTCKYCYPFNTVLRMRGTVRAKHPTNSKYTFLLTHWFWIQFNTLKSKEVLNRKKKHEKKEVTNMVFFLHVYNTEISY